MTKQRMQRSAGDNEYLHPDFHGALSAGIEYLHQQYGEEAVREYLWQFARAFYAPLTNDLQRRGLVALRSTSAESTTWSRLPFVLPVRRTNCESR